MTREREPLVLFGPAATDAIEALPTEKPESSCTPASTRTVSPTGRSSATTNGTIAADETIALPRLRGRRINGIPQTVEGFIPVAPTRSSWG